MKLSPKSRAISVAAVLFAPAVALATPAVSNVSPGEMAGMRQLFAVDDDQFDFNDAYTVNNLADILPGSFNRVAYYVELGPAGDTRWVWVSMDTFNTNPAGLGVPRAGTGIVENGTVVSNLTVETNHPGVSPGDYDSGIIEFWASNYNQNGGGQFGSNDGVFDWKDSGGTSGGGHGSFQVFAFTNPGMTAAQTLFGITANGGSGIGNQASATAPDWTFGPSTGTYAIRNLEIWVDTVAGLSTSDAVVAEGNAGTSQLVFDVTLSGAVDAPFTVDYVIEEETATALDGDISGPLSGTLSFAGTAGEVQQISVDVTGDTKVELNETVAVRLENLQLNGSDPVAGVAGGTGSVFTNVPEAADYTLVYDLAIPNSAAFTGGNPVTYTTDNSAGITGDFDRVAYYMELDDGTGPRWVFVSADAFTSDAGQLGLPHTVNNPVVFQQIISNMNVASNVPGIVTGNGIATGNVEFWPTNYQQPNNIGIPGANGGTFDFGDQPSPGSYGSFQIHNHGAGQVLFAYNRWGGTGGISDLGIGNATSGQQDHTFSQNAAGYTVKNLQVLVRPEAATGTIVNDDSATLAIADASVAEGDSGTAQLTFDVTLDNAVDVPITVDFATQDDAATTADGDYAANSGSLNFSGAGGQTLQIAVNVNGDCAVEPDEVLKVLLSNLQAGGRNVVLSGSGAGPGGPEAVFTNVPEANSYELVYDLVLDNVLNWDTVVPYATDNSASVATGSFDRIAYYLELDGDFVYVSVDAFTNDAALIGVPGSAGSDTVFQQNLSNMNVASNVAGIVTGAGIGTGNIEFWKYNYGTANAAGVPGANNGTYDFGDQSAGSNDHGSMQIHNYGAGQTLFAVNLFNRSLPGEMGIGNAPGTHSDWTGANNGASYTNKRLQILVRTGAPASVTADGTIVNDDFAPQVTPPGIADTTILTSAPQVTVALFPHFQDADDADSALAYAVTTNTDTALVQTSPINSADGLLVLDTPCTLKGTADITVTVTDPCGLSISDTFTVTVVDDVAPVLEVKDVVRTILNTLTEVTIDPFTFSAEDKVDGPVAVQYSPDTSSPFPVGVTPVTATATDSSGNTATAVFNVVILHEHPSPGPRFLDVVSIRGDAVSGPGIPAGATVFNVNNAYLNNAGEILYDAVLSGAGTSNIAMFSGPVAGPHTAVAVKGAAAPGGGVFGAFSHLALNDGGASSFQSLNGTNPAQYAGGSLVAIKGGVAPTGGGEEFIVLQKPALAADGSLLVTGNLRLGSGAGVTVGDDTLILQDSSTVLAREGLASSIPATDYGQIHPRVVASEDNDYYAFSAYLLEAVFDPSDNTALFAGALGGGAPQAVVREGDPADGGGGAYFFGFLGESVNSSGEIVLRANLGGAGISAQNNEGLWTNAGNTAAPPVLIAREGEVAPCLPNELAAFGRFSTFFIGDDGSVCFLAYLKNATAVPAVNSGNDGSLWRWKDGRLTLIAREGDLANNTSGAVIRSIGKLTYSGSGAVAYDVSLVTGIGDTTTTTNLAVYVDRGAADPAPLLVIRRSDTFDYSGTTYKVAGIKLSVESNPGGGTGGYGRAINDAGEIILNLTLDNNTSGIFVLSTP